MTVKIEVIGDNWKDVLEDIKGLASATTANATTTTVVASPAVSVEAPAPAATVAVETPVEAPAVVTPTEPVAVVTPTEPDVDHDINGDTWNAEIHQASKEKTKAGVWKKKPVRKTKPAAPVETAPAAGALPLETPVTTQADAVAAPVVTPAAATGTEKSFGDIMKIYVALDSTDQGKAGMAEIATTFGLASIPDVSQEANRHLIPTLYDAIEVLQKSVEAA